MKKYLILITIMCLILTGCGSYKLEDAVNDFTKSVENSKSYKLNGTMEISSGEELFTYNIDAYFLKDDFYKIVLVNQTNNHEQVILKNKEGLYVVTPSLNKSFKFDSVWPENSSQAYLLQNLVTDIKNDNEKTLEKNEKGYVIKSKVNYPNNEELVYQKIYFDKDMNITGVEVYNKEDIIKIKVTFKSVNMKAKLKEDDFVLDDLIDTNTKTDDKNTDNTKCTGSNCPEQKKCEGKDCDKTTGSLDSIIYPLYIPMNTHLKSSETVETAGGDRVILTFSGENVSYYLVSSDLSSSEMVNVAKSLGNSKTVISTK